MAESSSESRYDTNTIAENAGYASYFEHVMHHYHSVLTTVNNLLLLKRLALFTAHYNDFLNTESHITDYYSEKLLVLTLFLPCLIHERQSDEPSDFVN